MRGDSVDFFPRRAIGRVGLVRCEMFAYRVDIAREHLRELGVPRVVQDRPPGEEGRCCASVGAVLTILRGGEGFSADSAVVGSDAAVDPKELWLRILSH